MVALDQIWNDERKQVKSVLRNKDGSFLDLPFAEGVECSAPQKLDHRRAFLMA